MSEETTTAEEVVDPSKMSFTESSLRRGKCPICKGRRELPSDKSPTGWEACVCKQQLELLDILGPEMKDIPCEGEGGGKLHKLYRSTVFFRFKTMNFDRMKKMILGKVRRILTEEFREVLRARGKGEYKALPEWMWIQSERAMKLYMTDDVDEVPLRKSLMYHHPWVLMELGNASSSAKHVEHRGYPFAVLAVLRTRKDLGLPTWIVTTRDDNTIRSIYGPETLEWLDEQETLEIK